jgi:hypothetical protein
MRQFIAIAATAIISAVVASWGTTVIMADVAHKASVAPEAASIDIMQMMRSAKNLPEERYDAN